MKYEPGKHLEYFRNLIQSGAKREVVCDAIVVGLGLDEKFDDLMGEGDTLEAEIFDLAIHYESSEFSKEEKQEFFQEILDLLEVSEPKK